MLTGEQIRAARGALSWSLADLAAASRVSLSTVRRAEMTAGTPNVTPANLEAVKRALEAAGIEFIGTPDKAHGILIHRPPSTD